MSDDKDPGVFDKLVGNYIYKIAEAIWSFIVDGISKVGQGSQNFMAN